MSYRKMTAHTLNAIKGWPRPSALDFVAPFDPSQLAAVTGNVAFSGRVVHVIKSGSTLYYNFGVGSHDMPLFLFQNSDDQDVTNDPGDSTAWLPVTPSGNIMALVATGAYELESTEFDSGQTYNPNDLLKAATGTTLATAGVLTNASITNSVPVCGVVSRGVSTNSAGKLSLAFWPVFCPVRGS